MAEADKNQKQGRLKKKTLPRGTSEYQAAWIVDETDEEDSDNGDSDDNGMVLDRGEDSNQEGMYDQEFEDDGKSLNLRDIDTETQNESEMVVYISVHLLL
jgi:pre-rRNA-processing protein TSR1